MVIARRELVEQEIAQLEADGADLYFKLITEVNPAQDLVQYKSKSEKLHSLKTDLYIIDYILAKG